jgi:ornithine decarboxylase
MRLEREENDTSYNNNNNNEQNIESERQKRSKKPENRFETTDQKTENRLEAMQQIVESGQQEDAFFLCDQDRLVQNFNYWTDKLQNVTPYFDAGCNTSSMVLSTLAQLGAKFSCQNKLEMEQLKKIGIPAQDIMFGSSVKVASHLRFAASCGIDVMGFESSAEIIKIKKNSPNARLVYRLNFPASPSQTLSIPNMSELLTAATSAGLPVVGVSLNMLDTSINSYQKAISLARLIFALGKSLGHDLSLLDLGELIPNVDNFQQFEELVLSIQSWVTFQFKSLDNFTDLQLFAHPSNFIVDSAFVLATKVIGKRVAKSGSNVCYVVNDGIFGAFGRLLHDDDVTLTPSPLVKNGDDVLATTCDVYGPSGHDMDQICFNHSMTDVDIGDWLVFENMGSFAMIQWEDNYSALKRQECQHEAALLVAENFWFYSKIDDLANASNVTSFGDEDKAGSASDDEEVLCAFYQLPDIDLDQNDEDNFFTLLR